jgi:hypothetical protein
MDCQTIHSGCRHRAPVAVLAALSLLFASCGKEPAPSTTPAGPAQAAAAGGADPSTTGGLLVKSNRPDAVIEVMPAGSGGEAPTPIARGAPDKPVAGLAPGAYMVVARAEGWPEVRGTATVVAGQTAELALDFKAGSLRLDSVPAGATVKQGERVLGKTPFVAPALPPGELALVLEYPYWPAHPLKVTIAEGTETAETIRLPHGRLSVASLPAGATVILEGRNYGKTPLFWEHFPAGNRKLTLQAPGFPAFELPVAMTDGAEIKLRPELGSSFPLLAPATLLRAVWVPDNPDKLTESFDVVGKFAPQNGIVKNLDRKKLFENWLRRKYRYRSVIKAFNGGTGQVEFAENKSDLARFRVLAKLAPSALGDPALAAKGATIEVFGTLIATEEPRWPAKVITLELTDAELLHPADLASP